MAEQLVQIGGAVLILAAFGAAQWGWVAIGSRRYLYPNFVGATVLATVAAVDQQWGFLLLEGVWAIVSLSELVRRRSVLS